MTAPTVPALAVGCAGRFVPGRRVVVVAVACRDGGHTALIPAGGMVADPVAAEAIAATVGLELAARLGYRSVVVMLTGQLALCARIRLRAPVPELDEHWNERLRNALAGVRELSTIATTAETAEPLQAGAVARCAALAEAQMREGSETR